MAEETNINEVIKWVKSQADMQRQWVETCDPRILLPTPDALALIAELETVRAERDALLRERMIFRQALEAVRNRAIDAQGKWASVVPEHAPMDVWEYKIIAEIGDKAVFEVDNLRRIADERNDQPAPQAWTPRLNEKVWINEDSRVGTVIRVMEELGFPYGVAWHSTDRISEWYALEDLSRYED